jgi:hypothetical protein
MFNEQVSDKPKKITDFNKMSYYTSVRLRVMYEVWCLLGCYAVWLL